MDPFFSIITPVRNGEKFLNRYLRSLFDQTFTDFEVIIVDDKSQDESYRKLKKETLHDKRFLIISLNNEKEISGPYLARNTAIDFSKGKYICFLDIDDYWLPNKLQRNYEILSKIVLLSLSFIRYNLKAKKYFLRSPLILFNIKFSLIFLIRFLY